MAANYKNWQKGAQRGNVRSGTEGFATKCYQVHSRSLELVRADGKVHRPEPAVPSDAGNPCYKQGGRVILVKKGVYL